MSIFWRWLTGSDPEGPRRARRPAAGHRTEFMPLECRQLMAITMGTSVAKGTTLTNGTVLTSDLVLPPVQVAPQFLFPSDGRYVPVTVSGGLKSTYTMSFEGQYAIFPKPASTANILSQLPLAGPTDKTPLTTPGQPQTYTASVPGSKVPLTVSYTLDNYLPGVAVYTVKLPNYSYPMTIAAVWQGSTIKNAKGTYDGFYDISFKTLPISDYEASVITARFNQRKGPVDAVLNVTDQYRQDEPRAVTPLTLLVTPGTLLFGAQSFVKSTYPERFTIPTGEFIYRQYSYSFSTHLQALKHPGTGGRQYIINVSSEDADDGGSANTAAIVPNDAATVRR